MANELAPKVNQQVAFEQPIAPVSEQSTGSALTGLAAGLFNAAGSYLKAKDGTAASRKEERDTKARASLAQTFDKASQIDDPRARSRFLRTSSGNFLSAGGDPTMLGEVATAYGFDDVASVVVSPEQQLQDKMVNDPVFNLQYSYYSSQGLGHDQAFARASQKYEVREFGGDLTRENFDLRMTDGFSSTYQILQQVHGRPDVAFDNNMVQQLDASRREFATKAEQEAIRLGIDWTKTQAFAQNQMAESMLAAGDVDQRLRELYSPGSLVSVARKVNAEDPSKMSDEQLALFTAYMSDKNVSGIVGKDLDMGFARLVSSGALDDGVMEVLKQRLNSLRDMTIIDSPDAYNKWSNKELLAADGASPLATSREGMSEKALATDVRISDQVDKNFTIHKRAVAALDNDTAADVIESTAKGFESMHALKIKTGRAGVVTDRMLDNYMYREGGEGTATNIEQLFVKSFKAGTPEYVFDINKWVGVVNDNIRIESDDLQATYGKASTKYKTPQLFYIGQGELGAVSYNFDRGVVQDQIDATEKEVAKLIEQTGNPTAGQELSKKVLALQGIITELDGVVGAGGTSATAEQLKALTPRIRRYNQMLGQDNPLVSLMEAQGSAQGAGFLEQVARIDKLQAFNTELFRMGNRFSLVTNGPEEEGGIAVVDQGRGSVLEPNAVQPVVDVEVAEDKSDLRMRLDEAARIKPNAPDGIVEDTVFSRLNDEILEAVNFEGIKNLIKKEEGFSEEAIIPVKGDVPTIGYGFTEGVKMGDKISPEEAEKRLDDEVSKRLVQIADRIPAYTSFPEEVQNAMFSSWYRGSLSGSPKTLSLINEGKFREAADEFLDNDEYRNANELGRPGIRKRMKNTSDLIRSMAKPVIKIESSDDKRKVTKATIVPSIPDSVAEIFETDVDLIPANVKAAIGDVVPMLAADKIDEDFLDRSDLAILKKAAEKATSEGRSNIKYSDFGLSADDLLDKSAPEAIAASLKDPAFRMATLIGRAKVSKSGDGFTVKDTYDFNSGPKGRRAKKLWDAGDMKGFWNSISDEPWLTKVRIMMFAIQDADEGGTAVDIKIK